MKQAPLTALPVFSETCFSCGIKEPEALSFMALSQAYRRFGWWIGKGCPRPCCDINLTLSVSENLWF